MTAAILPQFPLSTHVLKTFRRLRLLDIDFEEFYFSLVSHLVEIYAYFIVDDLFMYRHLRFMFV